MIPHRQIEGFIVIVKGRTHFGFDKNIPAICAQGVTEAGLILKLKKYKQHYNSLK